MKIVEIIQHCLTGIDGITYDPARIYLAAAVLVFLGGAVTAIINTHTIDYQSFGIGFGALIAGGGFGIGAKAKTEPGQSAPVIQTN